MTWRIERVKPQLAAAAQTDPLSQKRQDASCVAVKRTSGRTLVSTFPGQAKNRGL